MDVLYIVMPAYNEQDNIEDVVSSWYPVLEVADRKSKLIVNDSGSKDNTHSILLEMQKKYPQLEIVSNTNQFHGPKVISLYRKAIDEGADYIFQTDSDGQTDPDEFKAFWELREEYDAILGERTVRGDGQIRKFVENVVCLFLRVFFGVKVPDANAPFRLMKADVLNKYIDRLPEDYNLPNIMFTTFFSFYKEKLCFKEISFKPRQAGTNSINIRKIIKIGLAAMKDFYNFRKDM